MDETSLLQRPRTALIVGSSLQNYNIIKEFMISEAQFEVVSFAETAHEGIATATQIQPALVIIDVSTPDMESVTVAEHVIKNVVNVSIIMISTATDPNWMKRAMKVGVRHFQSKPIDKASFLDTVISSITQY